MAVVIDNQRHGPRPFIRSQRCRLQSLTHFDLSALHRAQPCPPPAVSTTASPVSVTAATFHRSFSTPCLSTTGDHTVAPRVQTVIGRLASPRLQALVAEVAIAMASGVAPAPITAGLGGAYLLRTRHGGNLAVIKPADEEPLALNNPKGFAGRIMGQPGLKRSIRVGETGMRELAAYLLDHGGFAGVPPTTLVRIRHPAFHFNDRHTTLCPSPAPGKLASLQRYVDHTSDAGDLGPSTFSVSSVHRIAILDISLLNLDRHAGNMLVKKQDRLCRGVDEPMDLVPIDHGLCLPEWLDDPYFEWLHWPQAAIPFSGGELEYISKLDPKKDAELLRSALPSLPEASIRVFLVCTILLKRAAAAGLCPADIGEMMTRESYRGEEVPSVLESICVAAMEVACAAQTDGESEGSVDGDTVREEVFQLENGNHDDDDDDERKQERREKAQRAPPLFYRRSKEEDEGWEANKGGCLMKSMSFAAPSHSQEAGGIGFAEMGQTEWEVFLEELEEMLPQALEGRDAGLKQRLGTSV